MSPTNARTARTAKIHKLIDALAQRDLAFNECCRIPGCASSSVVHGYLYDLIEFGVVQRVDKKYRLIGSDVQLEAFFAMLDAHKHAPTHLPSLLGRPRNRDKPGVNFARHLHMMIDDEPFQLKVPRLCVASDPKALPRQFFQRGAEA